MVSAEVARSIRRKSHGSGGRAYISTRKISIGLSKGMYTAIKGYRKSTYTAMTVNAMTMVLCVITEVVGLRPFMRALGVSADMISVVILSLKLSR